MSQWDNPPTAAEYLANQTYWTDHNIINPKNGQLQSEYTTQPTEPLGSQPKGERPTVSKGDGKGIKLEEKSGEILANNGFDVEYLNDISGGNGYDVDPIGEMNPDYWIDGKIFDGYAPDSNRYKTIRDGIKYKVKDGQTSNIVLNLDNVNRGAEEVLERLIKRPINGLEEIFIIKGDTLLHYHFK